MTELLMVNIAVNLSPALTAGSPTTLKQFRSLAEDPDDDYAHRNCISI